MHIFNTKTDIKVNRSWLIEEYSILHTSSVVCANYLYNLYDILPVYSLL